MKIVEIGAEFAPLAKVGGLGDVMLGLSRELTRRGEEVEIILPKYDFIDLKKIGSLKLEVPDFKCPEKGNLHANAMWSGTCEECRLHLLEARHPSGYFHRGKVYGCDDDAIRFLYFSRACVEYLKLKKEPIDILHLHDWHVAAIAPLVRDLIQLPIKAIVLTLHNAEYQGHCATWDLDAIGLKGEDYLIPEKMLDDDPKKGKTINLLKGGIIYADAVVAVSPTYAKEIMTPEMGFHLDGALRKAKEKVTGILNGIDSQIWDPQKDEVLPTPFGASSPFSAIEAAKEAAKETLRRRFSLAKGARPWVGSILRLVPQKGPELVMEALRHTLRSNGTFILLGSSPYPTIQEEFNKLKKEFKGNDRVVLHFEFDEALSHLVYAALDCLVAPSHYEPCGLTQLIAMHYGTIPIVHATGGLKDTVFDCENPKIPAKNRNGFVFTQAKPQALIATLDRAFHVFNTEKAIWQTLIQKGMERDVSWKGPAQDYLKKFRSLIRPASSLSNFPVLF